MDPTKATLDVTVSIGNVEDSISTVRVSKANPVPGVNQGNPGHALDESFPENFVETEWVNWGTILRIEARSETPDPGCGTGLDCVFITVVSHEAEDEQELEARRFGERGHRYLAAVMLVGTDGEDEVTVEITGADGEARNAELLAVNEEDEVWIEFQNLRSSVEVENEPPEFDYFWPEHARRLTMRMWNSHSW